MVRYVFTASSASDRHRIVVFGYSILVCFYSLNHVKPGLLIFKGNDEEPPFVVIGLIHLQVTRYPWARVEKVDDNDLTDKFLETIYGVLPVNFTEILAMWSC
jgi:hypothetical protein